VTCVLEEEKEKKKEEENREVQEGRRG